MKHELKIPMRLLSEANTHQHWRKKHARNKRQQNAIRLVWLSKKPNVKIPCEVKLIRSGPRLLDFDNMVYAFKNIRDCVGSLILPNLAAGQADGADSGISWSYDQEKGLYGVRIEIEEKN